MLIDNDGRVMKRCTIIFRCLVVAGVIILSMVHTVDAQPLRTILIREGNVYVDGKQVPARQLPASLDTRGIDLQFSFTEGIEPVIPLNGRYYRFDDGNVVEVGSEEGNGQVSVFFRDRSPVSREAFAAEPLKNRAPAEFFVAGKPVEILLQQADELRRFSETMARRRESELANQARDWAQQITLVADQLPMVEVRRYLNDVQEHDRFLYRQLLREEELEQESQLLAAKLREMADTPDYRAGLQTLRAQLDEIFELKQENRRREIRQLERQIDELRKRLEERAINKDLIIDRRIQELIGADRRRP